MKISEEISLGHGKELYYKNVVSLRKFVIVHTEIRDPPFRYYYFSSTLIVLFL